MGLIPAAKAALIGVLGKTGSVAKSFDVQHGKPYRILRQKDTIIPIVVVSSIFCMWGLAYGLLDLMNYHVKVAMGIAREDAAVLAAGYYGAYIPGSLLIGGPLVNKAGYRLAMIVGLAGLALGDFLMSIGAERYSLPGMVAGHFVIGLGVSTLERAANPYTVNCGPRVGGTLRILFAQAWAGIGTVIAPFLANAFVFDAHSSSTKPAPDLAQPGKCLMPSTSTASVGPVDGITIAARAAAASTPRGDLSSVIIFYRGLGGIIFGLTIFLAIVFFRTNLVPEVPIPSSPKDTTSPFSRYKSRTSKVLHFYTHPLFSLRYSRLWWAVPANFINLGCQVTFAQFFMEHMRVNACASDKWAAICMSFAQIAFVVGRFAAAGLVCFPRLFRPRYVLCAFIAGAVAFTASGTAVHGGGLAVTLAVMVMFFEAPSFPMIFESATADLGGWTPAAETLMIVSICGGALQPALMGMLVSHVGISLGWWLTASCFVFVWSYTLGCNIIPSFRRSLDRAQGGTSDDDNSNTYRDADAENRGRPRVLTPCNSTYGHGDGQDNDYEEQHEKSTRKALVTSDSNTDFVLTPAPSPRSHYDLSFNNENNETKADVEKSRPRPVGMYYQNRGASPQPPTYRLVNGYVTRVGSSTTGMTYPCISHDEDIGVAVTTK